MNFKVSIDTPAFFLTAVGKDRLPVFQNEHIKNLTCEAINEARNSCRFLLFAYVITPDHVNMLTDAPRRPSEVLQYIKGIVGPRVSDYLKAHNYEASLEKLPQESWKRNHYSLWQHDSDVFSITSESKFMQKVNYIHLNPVRAGLVESAAEYRWSSFPLVE